MTPTITEFLLARIAEDEAVARRAEESPGSYRGHPAGTAPVWTVSAASAYGREIGPRGSIEATPGRVLAECAAKRTIIEYAIDVLGGALTVRAGAAVPTTRPDVAILRLLTQPYADHPDFRPEWRA